MSESIPRRQFFNRGLGAGLGVALLPGAGRLAAVTGTVPIIVTSHRNKVGTDGITAGYEILAEGGSALDAVEKATNMIELDPEDMSVGYGGAPNEAGVVQLDASVMDGGTYNAGAVAAIENIRNPSSVARKVMERTDHVMLVGRGALDFAKKMGFPEEEMLTGKAREAWLRWRENLNDRDKWGPPEHLRGRESTGTLDQAIAEAVEIHGTVNVLAIDSNGDIAGITSTSGYAWKIPGRVGDSPIIGAGLYVDNEVGSAGAVGRGEDVIKACSSYHIVMRMREGRSPEEACMDALRMIEERYRKVNPDYYPGEHFIALSRNGEVGCAAMTGSARMSVLDADGLRYVDGPGLR